MCPKIAFLRSEVCTGASKSQTVLGLFRRTARLSARQVVTNAVLVHSDVDSPCSAGHLTVPPPSPPALLDAGTNCPPLAGFPAAVEKAPMQQPARPAGAQAGGVPMAMPMPFPIIQNVNQLSELRCDVPVCFSQLLAVCLCSASNCRMQRHRPTPQPPLNRKLANASRLQPRTHHCPFAACMRLIMRGRAWRCSVEQLCMSALVPPAPAAASLWPR